MSLITQQATAMRNLRTLPFPCDEETEAEHLRHRTQLLAQELKDLIFDFATVIETGKDIKIDETYRPPRVLSVDRVSRESAFRQYYSTNTFVLTSASKHYTNLLFRWLQNLPVGHRYMIQNIKVPLYARTKAVDSWVVLRGSAAQRIIACDFIGDDLDGAVDEFTTQGIIRIQDRFKADAEKMEDETEELFSVDGLERIEKVLDDEYQEWLHDNRWGSKTLP